MSRPNEAAVLRAQAEAQAKSILVTTGDVQAKYLPINIVFAVGGSAGGLFKSPSPQEAFEAARFQLQLAAVALGGSAVVACRFGYSETSAQGCSASKFTVHGYGTVVKFA